MYVLSPVLSIGHLLCVKVVGNFSLTYSITIFCFVSRSKRHNGRSNNIETGRPRVLDLIPAGRFRFQRDQKHGEGEGTVHEDMIY